jgi:hypothetical protein
MNDKFEVAQTIWSQLGSRMFGVMTGATKFEFNERSLSFKLPGKNFAKHDINHVEIVLRGDDTYLMIFSRKRGKKNIAIETRAGVYCDMLQETFTEVTGLQTHL